MEFVHIPKTGGQSISDYLNLRTEKAHSLRCDSNGSYFTVVREPISRFDSMYRFWRNGSTEHRRDHVFKKKVQDVTVKDYICMIQEQKSDLCHAFTTDAHVKPQSYWIPRDSWPNVVVIRYQSDMKVQLQKILEYLGRSQTKALPLRNVSNGSRETLDEYDLLWVREYYKDDFELWDHVNNSPELFKNVI